MYLDVVAQYMCGGKRTTFNYVFLIFFIAYTNLCVCMCVGPYVPQCASGYQRTPGESHLFFYCVGLEDWTWVVRFDSSHLCPLSHHTGPRTRVSSVLRLHVEDVNSPAVNKGRDVTFLLDSCHLNMTQEMSCDMQILSWTKRHLQNVFIVLIITDLSREYLSLLVIVW